VNIIIALLVVLIALMLFIAYKALKIHNTVYHVATDIVSNQGEISKAMEVHFKSLHFNGDYQNHYLSEIAKSVFKESIVNLHILNSVNKSLANIVYSKDSDPLKDEHIKCYCLQLHVEASKYAEEK